VSHTTKDFYHRTNRTFAEMARAIGDDQWTRPTPCRKWDVRQLLNHLASEAMWTAPLLDGATLEEIGDRFDGDVLGEDPRATFARTADEALDAVEAAPLDRMVQLSSGETPAARYVAELTLDFLVHGWDLAKGIGADPTMDPEISETMLMALGPFEPMLRSSGVFGERVPTDDADDVQVRLLGLLGRRADWTPPA
jgi:uncharacterized protein (TIGR03086 family)